VFRSRRSVEFVEFQRLKGQAMNNTAKEKAGTAFLRLRDQFERLARDFAAKPLRAVVSFEPRDERSPEEREEDPEFRPVSVWLRSPTNPAALAALDMVAEEVEAAFEAEGERVGPGRTPAERWLLRVAHARPWKHPLRHGAWESATTWDEAAEETSIEIGDVFRASALALERIATADRSPREIKAEREARALAILREHPDWSKVRIAEEMGLPDSSFLSRSDAFQRAWKARR
jgi:hypothetical protein